MDKMPTNLELQRYHSPEPKVVDINRLGAIRDELAIRKLIDALNNANSVLVAFNRALDEFEEALEKRNESTK